MFLDEKQVGVWLSGFVGGEFFGAGLFCEGVFQVGEDLCASFYYGFWDAGEFGYVYAVAFVGAAGQDFVEEDDVVGPFADGDVAVFDIRQQVRKLGQLMVVGGKEGAAFDLVCDVLGDRPG